MKADDLKENDDAGGHGFVRAQNGEATKRFPPYYGGRLQPSAVVNGLAGKSCGDVPVHSLCFQAEELNGRIGSQGTIKSRR